MSFDLVAIGNPVYDIIITPWASSQGRVLSGCSTNACIAAKRLGFAKVGLVGCIGPDYRDSFISYMRANGIEARALRSSKTGGFKLVYDAGGDRTLEVIAISGKISANQIPEDFLNTRNIILGPVLDEVGFELASYLRSSTTARILLDPQGLIRAVASDGMIVYGCDQRAMAKAFAQVDIVKPNEHEAYVITGSRSPEEAAKRLLDMGAPLAIVTLAERGSIVYDGTSSIRIPAYRTDLRDPTGAGDVYAGSFIYEYQKTGDLRWAGLVASAAASIAVEVIGPDFPITREEVYRRASILRSI